MHDANAITEQFNFLQVLAQGCPEGLRFIVAKKHTYVDQNSGKTRLGFPTEAWREQYLEGPWYFSTGASDLARSRRRENLKALRAIVIDDIGTKVDADKLLAAPTWVLETSPGNFQWGYMLKEWTTDIHAGDELFAGLVAAGLQDPGVRTCCRLFRIPDSVNDKPGMNGYRAVLHSFDADIVYTLSSLTKALKVKPGKVDKPRADRPALDIDPQKFPDAVFDWLGEQGLINYEGTEGWWDFVCPFADEHSKGNDDGTRYRPRWASPDGCSGVMCNHGHGGIDGAEYRRRFIAWLGEVGAPSWPLPARHSMNDYGDVLRKLLPPPPPPKTPQATHNPEPPEPHGRHTIGTLREALGTIALSALPDLEMTEKGVIARRQLTTFNNIEAGLDYLGVKPRLNLMNGNTSYILPERVDPRGFGDMDERAIAELVTDTLIDIFNLSRLTNDAKLEAGLDGIASRNSWHPMRDWILSKPWDGKDRFEALAGSLPTPKPKLFKVYFRRWLLQGVEAACGWAVGRTKEQKGLVLVLVGPQRIGKTRWLMSLAPDFSKAGRHLNLNGHGSRDSIHEALQGVIVELGELDGTFRKSDIAALKAFITETVDEYRLPYGKRWGRRPRCTSFCGSVNEHRFLNDPTGSGRFLPVEVSGVPQVDHAIDMQQLWAQMHAEWAGGAPWYMTRDEENMRDIDSGDFQAVDGVAEAIAESLADREDREAFPIEAIVGPGAMCDLCGVDASQPRNCTTAGRMLHERLGKGRDLRPYGANVSKPRWAIGVTESERQRHGLKATTKPVRRA